MRKITAFIITIFFASTIFAQTDCNSAILMTDLDNYCSNPGEFDNTGIGNSAITAGCWTDNNDDIWFEFQATAPYVDIVVNGDVFGNGTLQNPQVVLYSGDCTNPMVEFCNSENSENFAKIIASPLTIGETYYISVNGINNSGSFQLCLNAYLPPVVAGQDCNTAYFLCNKNTIGVQAAQLGSGVDDQEGVESCFDERPVIFGNPIGPYTAESNTSWYTWTAATNGAMTFVLDPVNPGMDIDFILFELPNGVNDCSGKTPIRCSIAGDSYSANPTSDCVGPTGLDMTSTDTEESSGCLAGQDHFVQFVNATVGTSYGLLVEIAASSDILDDGYDLSFGGDVEFQGPVADFIASTTSACGTTQITFTDNSTGANNWEWDFGPDATPTTASGQGPHNVTFPSGNHVAVLNIDGAGCQDFHSIPIAIGDLDVSLSMTQSTCGNNDGSVIVTVNSGGDGTFDYTIDGGMPITNNTGTHTYNGIGSGNHTIEVTSGGCTFTDIINVTNAGVVTNADVTIMADETNICAGDVVTFTATPINGGTMPTYVWQINGTTVSTGTNSTYATGSLNNGDIITVIMTSNEACINNNPATSNTIVITVTTITPSVSIVADQTNICAGDNVTFTATPTNGGTMPTYQWQLNGTDIAGATNSIFNSSTLNNGDQITVIMTSNDPCASPTQATSNIVTITISTITPTVSISTIDANICQGEMINFTSTQTGGGTNPSYQWQLNGVDVAGATNSTYNSSTSNNGDQVTLIMNSSASCASPTQANSNTITINVSDISAMIDNITPEDCNDMNGTGTVIGTSVFGNITYDWGNGQNTSTATNLETGTFNVTVTDNELCQFVIPVQISNLSGPIITIEEIIDESCGQMDGSATISFTSESNTNYTVNWSNGQSGLTASNLSVGVYQVTVTNGGTCIATEQIIIGNNNSPMIDVVREQNDICGQGIGEAEISITGGEEPYVIEWSNGNNTLIADGLIAGNYTVTVTDANDCEVIANVTIGDDLGQEVEIVRVIDANCNQEDGSILINIIGGIAPYTITWKDTLGNLIATNEYLVKNLKSDLYVYTIVDQGGCIVTGNIQVGNLNGTQVNAIDDQTITIGESVILSTDQVSGDFNWYPPVGLSCFDCPTPVAEPLETTSYIVTHENEFGCESKDTILVTVIEQIGGVYVPTGFTPNGDGVNDIIFPNGIEVESIKVFRIYDRWGELVFEGKDFEANNPLFGWNGTFKGESLDPAVFTWYTEAKLTNQNTIINKGDFTLFR